MEVLLRVKQLLPDSQAAALAVLLKERSTAAGASVTNLPPVIPLPPPSQPQHTQPSRATARRDSTTSNNNTPVYSDATHPGSSSSGGNGTGKIFNNGLVSIPQPPPLMMSGTAGGGGSSVGGMGQQGDTGAGKMRNKFLDFTRKLGRKDEPKPLQQLQAQLGGAISGGGATVLGAFGGNTQGGSVNSMANPGPSSSASFLSDDDED